MVGVVVLVIVLVVNMLPDLRRDIGAAYDPSSPTATATQLAGKISEVGGGRAGVLVGGVPDGLAASAGRGSFRFEETVDALGIVGGEQVRDKRRQRIVVRLVACRGVGKQPQRWLRGQAAPPFSSQAAPGRRLNGPARRQRWPSSGRYA
ncbi:MULTISPECIES: hypothetical protein [unclassified Pseudofrankia]|uniref:hypothetical protein n=1 Tax=unclassified Pseudofrankia TaxID=2994372 RepID=UPI0008D91AA5|nr:MULTISPECIES: hypothetical protein [unclassified Pseudofrankia]MDT3441879.1 hypothetical protein [Pseudofrankia sp. BMG5.37]OHV45654.1 hypothetical protein BCD48_21925 [Pseudofrankia sp. BMG5.36]